MNRHLFRGKQTQGMKQWITGFYIKATDSQFPCIIRLKNLDEVKEFDHMAIDYLMESVDPATIGQAIGINDKNGEDEM